MLEGQKKHARKRLTGPGDTLLAIANTVAMRHGLRAIIADQGEECEFDGDGDKCERCGHVMSKGHAVFYVRTCYESYEGSYYCSMACASSIMYPTFGSWQDFIERMGWTLWWFSDNNLDADPKWTLVDDRLGKPIAREGDARWHVDHAKAESMAQEFATLLAQGHG